MTYPHLNITQLCKYFGLSRQAYYKSVKHTELKLIKEDFIIDEILNIRRLHPRIGGRKLYYLLQDFLKTHHIKVGRDAFFKVLAKYNLLVKPRKKNVYTTQSFHYLKKYPNLIGHIVPNGINQIWVSDITYWKVKGYFLYISLITDAYSHRIVGYHLAHTLEALHTFKALKKAIENKRNYFQVGNGLIHHSDRGIQYCSHIYIDLLQKYDIQISMTENGDPLENALAERINGILKEEYLNEVEVLSLEQARNLLDKVIYLYNDRRPHLTMDYLTPNQVHQIEKVTFIKKWKNYKLKKYKNVNLDKDNKNIVTKVKDYKQIM